MKLKVYEYMVLLHPSDDEDVSRIIVDKKTVLGKDEKSVAMRATREIPTDYDDLLDQVEVVVRPF